MFYACGDYNINLLQCDVNHKIASYLKSVTSSGSFCLIDKPTRLGESSATLLDHFYTNNLTTPLTSGIPESDISEHLPILVSIHSCIPTHSPALYKFRRHTNKIDYEKFNNELHDILQKKLSHSGMSVHQKFDTFISTLKNLLDKHAPLIRQSRRERNLVQKTWIAKAIMVSIRHKNRLFSKICKNRAPSATVAYKKCRILLTRIKYKAKQHQELFIAYKKILARHGQLYMILSVKSKSAQPYQKL